MVRFTEVEAKFKVTDRAIFDQILRAERLGRFGVTDGPLLDVADIYMDTANRALSAGGYACRLRCENGDWLAILKGLGGAKGAIHQREEVKTPLAAFEPNPARWPVGDARELALALAQGQPLSPLLTIRQVRRIRRVNDQARAIADLSLDEVQVEAGGRSDEYLELEAESVLDGTPEDVAALAGLFAVEWNLEPESTSKYHRALALLDAESDQPGIGRLRPGDRSTLERIARLDHPRYTRRAQLLLAWDDGADVHTLLRQAGYSRSRVYYWLHIYQKHGMSAFPPSVLAAVDRSAPLTSPAGSKRRPPTPRPAPLAPVAPRQAGSIDLPELFRRHRVDMEHARHVAELALALFDRAREHHGLTEASRRFLEQGALLHNVGLNADPDRHHSAGRDILLETPLVEFSEEQRRMLAAMIYLHRKPITPKKLKKKWVADLPAAQRREALEMAALIRMADGLDYSLSQTTRVTGARASTARIEIIVAGPQAEMDAVRAQEKADLWDLLHPAHMTFSLQNPGTGTPATEIAAANGKGNGDSGRPAPHDQRLARSGLKESSRPALRRWPDRA